MSATDDGSPAIANQTPRHDAPATDTHPDGHDAPATDTHPHGHDAPATDTHPHGHDAPAAGGQPDGHGTPRESLRRRLARALLTRAVRHRSARGGTWGEAVLAEFDELTTDAEAVRWAAGGIWVSWRERPSRLGLLFAAAVAWLFGGGWARRTAVLVTLSLGLGLVINQWILTVVYMPSPAMEPTIDIGDRMLVDQVGFRATGLDRGDLVLVSLPDHQRIMRLLGLPGDMLSCQDGRLHRNGSAVDEPYLAAGSVTDCTPVTVPANQLYLLGDNREAANDSRLEGFFNEDQVTGQVLFRLFSQHI